MYFRPGGRNDEQRFAFSYLTSQRYLELKCNEKKIESFFEMHNLKQIAIYGISEFGGYLYKDLKGSNIEISCFIDLDFAKYPNGYDNIPVVALEDTKAYEDVDMIVITSIYIYNQIIDELVKFNIPLEKIMNINDVVFGMG